MALKDKIARDNRRVFMRPDQFAQIHSWNGRPLLCVVDEENANRKKNQSSADQAWDNTTTEATVYAETARIEPLPGKLTPGEQVILDNRSYRIGQVQKDMGVTTVLLISTDPRTIGY